jgi:hypothetical protein
MFKNLSSNVKHALAAVTAGTVVFLGLPKLFKLIDPSSAILDLSVLSVISTGTVILTLAALTVWLFIQITFRRTLDALTDQEDFAERFKALPDELKFKLLFATVWVLLVTAVIAFKPILFVINGN